MHGRLKVKDSAEKAAEKAKEREKKRIKYLAAINILFKKRDAEQHDAEALSVSAGLLQVNPDALTLWNCRRNTLLAIREQYIAEAEKAKDASLNCLPANDSEISEESTDLGIVSATVDTETEDPSQLAPSQNCIVVCANDELSADIRWKKLLKIELDIVSSCLQHNPKSYGAWHHRVWVITQLTSSEEGKDNDPALLEENKKAWLAELELCNLFLTKDERNFHCWDYRRVVVQGGGVTAEQELRYSYRLIERNFSNFSAWHYRSKLLPLVHPPANGSTDDNGASQLPVEGTVFAKELERVKQAVFTDPGDQSPWFYLRWLLHPPPSSPRLVSVSAANSTDADGNKTLLMACSFTAAVSHQSLPVDLSWKRQASTLWTCTVSEAPKRLHFPSDDVTVTLETVREPGTERLEWLFGPQSLQQSPVNNSSAAQSMQQLADDCKLLDQVDPNNKWVLVSLVQVLWAIGGEENMSQAAKHLAALQAIDPLRRGYYADMRSKLLLQAAAGDYRNASLCVKDSQLTRLYWPEMLYARIIVDLRGNCLTGAGLHTMVMCSTLKLDDNVSLRTLEAVSRLPLLEHLSLQRCNISCPEFLAPLIACHTLLSLDVSGNPLCQSADAMCSVRQLLGHVQRLTFDK